MKTVYLKIKENRKSVVKQFIRERTSFEIHDTTFTRVIKTPTLRVIMNESGTPDFESLKLINKVRSDAKKVTKSRIKAINWYYYNDYNGANKMNGEVIKLDLNEAYWAAAQKMEVISENTHNDFLSLSDGYTTKRKKTLRLRALGALATRKLITTYIHGVKIEEHPVINKQSLETYKAVCGEVDDVLKNALLQFNGLYYYWDCLFINDKQTLADVSNYIKSQGYNFTLNKDFYTVYLSNLINHISLYKRAYRYPISKGDIL
jgi:hypothetical protein